MEDVEDMGAVTGAAARIVDDVARPVPLKEGEVVITASVGIAYSEAGHTDVESLLRDADLAMYRAKAAGKNRFVHASDTLQPAFETTSPQVETVPS